MSMTTNKQTRTVQRFANYGVDMIERDDGGYVKHSDYLALLDELEAAETTSAARLEAIDRTHKMFQRERDRADAAERRNAELMEKLAKLIDILDWHTIELGWGEKPITLAELIVAREGADSLSTFRAAATDKGE